MKRAWSVVVVSVFALGVASLALAQETKAAVADKENKESAMSQEGKMGGMGMMKHGGMGMMGPGGMMGAMMMNKSMVAASDGGVIVLFGNKLQKYDKDLVLQKEVELKFDKEAMMKQMMECCPTMQKMLEKCPMMEKMKSEAAAAGAGKGEAKK